jgi:hypothetical protein
MIDEILKSNTMQKMQYHCATLNRMRILTLILSTLVACSPLAASAQNATVSVPEISADQGNCSALFTVTGADAKPIYMAKLTTRVRSGWLSVKKLDLEAFTNSNGQVKITHLPAVLKRPLFFYISKDDKQESVEFKPDEQCQAIFNLQLK